MAGHERDLLDDVLDGDYDRSVLFESSSEASTTQSSTLTWISWYTSLPGHDYFCDVHEDFIEDDFNLTGLQSMVPFWKEALEMVLDVEPEEEGSSKIPDVSIVESSAELLYGLCHQRFILTKPGLAAMLDKYEQGHFGACPRFFCHATPVLPCGRADMPGVDTVKLYCPNCGDIYLPPSSKYVSLDGAFFGTTFAPLFFQTYPELLSTPFHADSSGSLPSSAQSNPYSSHPSGDAMSAPYSQSQFRSSADSSRSFPPGSPPLPSANPDPNGGQRPALGKIYQPRIYGFKVSERSRTGPRMGWLRARPDALDGLDQVDWRGKWREGYGENLPGSGAASGAVGQGAGAGAGVGTGVGTGGEAGPGQEKKRRGRLFDDEDEEVEEGAGSESEEEDEVAGDVRGAVLAQMGAEARAERKGV